MLKKIGFPFIALFALMLVVTPAPAKAGVHFGIAIGGPGYVAPVPAYGYGYAAPYAAPYPAYGYGYGYNYAAPTYGYYPYGGVSVGVYGRPYYRRGWVEPRGYYRHGYYDHGYRGGYYRR